MDNNELKPCACCNTDVELESWEVEHDHYDEYFYQIKCSNCGLMMKDSTTSNPYDNDIIKNLIGQWNTRACDCDRLESILDWVIAKLQEIANCRCQPGQEKLYCTVIAAATIAEIQMLRGKTEIQSIKGE